MEVAQVTQGLSAPQTESLLWVSITHISSTLEKKNPNETKSHYDSVGLESFVDGPVKLSLTQMTLRAHAKAAAPCGGEHVPVRLPRIAEHGRENLMI